MYCFKCGKQIVDDSIFCSYCGIRVSDVNQEDNSITNEDELVINACKECIKKHLRAPSTVSFASVEIKDRDNYGRVYLYAEVDAQNAFGGTLRNNLHVVLQKVNKDGTYEALNEAVYKVSFINTEDVVKRVNKWNKPIK